MEQKQEHICPECKEIERFCNCEKCNSCGWPLVQGDIDMCKECENWFQA